MTTPEELARALADLEAVRSAVEAERQRRRDAAKPKPKTRWVRVGDELSVADRAKPAPKVRGRYIERTVIDNGDPDRQVWTREQAAGVLYERSATLGTPDGKPELRPAEPKSPTIRVPRRTQVQTGAGEVPPKPTRWGLPPRDGQRKQGR